MAKYLGENALTYLVTLIKTALSGKVNTESGKGLSTNDYTAAEKAKLAGVATGANNYALPTASATTLGGVKVGAGLSVASGVLSTTGGGTADAVAWANVTGKPETFAPAEHNQAASTVTGLAAVATSGSYADLSNKPTLPTDNSQLANGAGYQTAAQVSGAIATAVSSAYKASGSVAFAALPVPSAANLGNVYNVTDAFTTTASFVEGAGKSYPANMNVAVVLVDATHKLDVLAGLVDLSGYLEASALVELTNTEVNTLWTAAG